MVINGKEYGLKFCVKSYDGIAKVCPDEDFSKLNQALSGADSLTNVAKCAVALNTAYEDWMHHQDPSYKQDYLTMADFEYLDIKDMIPVARAVSKAIQDGMHTTVKTESVKKNVKEAE